MNILLVEDDWLLADGLVNALKREGFTVNHVTDGSLAITHILAQPPDIVILDLGLPGIDGMTVLKEIRKKNVSLPVLILSARELLHDKITGLDSGADDYLTKPFEPKELMARLRVLERRISTPNTAEINIGHVTLNTSSHMITIDEKPVNCSRREYMLLKALMESAGSILSKENLENKLYSWGEEVVSNTIEVHVHNLRKKLPDNFIQTIHGMGYIIKKQ